MKLIKYVLLVLVATALAACGNDGVVPGGNASSVIVGSIKNNGSGLNNVSLTFSGAASGVASTNTTGYFNSGVLSPGGYTVTPSAPGYNFNPINQLVTVTKSGMVRADFDATQGQYVVSGQIVGDQTQGVALTLYDANGLTVGTATTDANGLFVIKNMAYGNYTLIPSMPGYLMSPSNKALSITSSNVTGLSFTSTFNPNGSGINNVVSGQISGAGVSSVSMSVYNSNGVSVGTAVTDANGRYSITVTANGSFTIVPNQTGYTYTPVSSVVTLNTSNATGVNFSSVAGASSTYTLAGVITGDISKGVTVSLYNGSNVFLQSTTSDQNGFYNFAGLNAATYNVVPALSGYSFSPAAPSVTIGASNVSNNNYTATKVVHTLSGQITTGPYSTVNLTGPSTTATTNTDSSGNYTFSVYLPGTYTIVPFKPGYSFVQPQAVVTYSNSDITGINFTGTFTPSISNNAVHGSVTYSCTGATITVPANVNTVQFDVQGGDGGSGTGTLGGSGGGGAIVYDYTSNQLLIFIGGGGGGAGGIGGQGKGGVGGSLTTFAAAGASGWVGSATYGVNGATYTGGSGGTGCYCDNVNQLGGSGVGGYGKGRGGVGGDLRGTSCLDGTVFPSGNAHGCNGEGAVFTSLTADTGKGGDSRNVGYSMGGGGGGGYGGGGGAGGSGSNGGGSETGGGGGGGGNFVLTGAIVSGNQATFNIDLSNHILGIMGSPAGYASGSNAGICGSVTAAW